MLKRVEGVWVGLLHCCGLGLYLLLCLTKGLGSCQRIERKKGQEIRIGQHIINNSPSLNIATGGIFHGTYLEGHVAEQVRRLRYMECSGTDRDPHHYWARGHVRGNRRGHEAADDAVCVDEGGPGGLMYRDGPAGTGHCGCWLETIPLGSWRRSDADREADPDLWVHTVQIVKTEEENKEMKVRY